MSRPLHELSPEKTSPNEPAGPVMVYVCECGTKWTDSARPSWKCKCGRHLVKRNRVICAAAGQTSQPAVNVRTIRGAADKQRPQGAALGWPVVIGRGGNDES